MHLCPTRVDRAPVLFAHAVTEPTCQTHQRQHYHKCWTCSHRNGGLDGAANGSGDARRALVGARHANGAR
jgi:hypothetical protein